MTDETLIHTQHLSTNDWQSFEKFALKQYVLWEHPTTGASIALLDFPKGSGIPEKHSHASNQFMYCLEGKYEYTDSNLVLTPGSFYSNPKDHPHGPTLAHERSILIEVYDGPHYYEMPDYHTDSTIGKVTSDEQYYMVIAVAANPLPGSDSAAYSAHQQFISGLSAQNLSHLSGSLGSESGSESLGTTYIISAESEQHAREIASNDPYTSEGLYMSVQIFPWHEHRG